MMSSTYESADELPIYDWDILSLFFLTVDPGGGRHQDFCFPMIERHRVDHLHQMLIAGLPVACVNIPLFTVLALPGCMPHDCAPDFLVHTGFEGIYLPHVSEVMDCGARIKTYRLNTTAWKLQVISFNLFRSLKG